MTTARWIGDLIAQLRRGRHVVLHGNVRDMAMYEGRLLAFGDALDAALEAVGYQLRASWNQADGLEFDDARSRGRWEELEQENGLVEAPSGRAYAPPNRRGSAASAGGNHVPEPNSRRPQTPMHIAPALAFSSVRRVLARDESQVAAVLDLADLIFGEQQSEGERGLLTTLQLAFTEAHRHVEGPLAGMRNVLVLVAPVLGQVPAWLYRDHPLVKTVAVGRPGRLERAAFLSRQWAGFFGAETERPSEDLTDAFTALTEDMSFWDLEALRLTSHHEQLPVGNARALLDVFRHGVREDPWEKLSISVLDEAQGRLSKQVMGQDSAIEAVLDVLSVARGGVGLDGARRSPRPKGVLFFVGPTGVGKTELAKAVTELIFHDPTAFARFDMSEFAQEHAAERLTGAPPSYVGYEAGGQLTNRMKARPFSLLLFDEIEKAHPRILDRFLQILDDGRLTDGLGDTVHFSQAFLIFTSNIGSTRVERRADGRELMVSAIDPDADYASVERHFRQAVRNHFIRIGRPELLGRIGEERIVVFDRLRTSHIRGILNKFLQGIAESAHDRHNVNVTFDNTFMAYAVQACSKPEVLSLGGRGIRNFVQGQLLAAVNRSIMANPGQSICIRATDDDVVVEVVP